MPRKKLPPPKNELAEQYMEVLERAAKQPDPPWVHMPPIPDSWCSVCKGEVRQSDGGPVCALGHGGADEPRPTFVEAHVPGYRSGMVRSEVIGGPRGGRVVLVPFAAARRVVQVESLEQLAAMTDDELRGAIVKVAPTLAPGDRAGFDAAVVSEAVRARGAAAVVVTPKIVGEGRLPTGAEVVVQQASTPRDAVVAWFDELTGLSDEDRAACIEHAHRAIDQAEGT